MTSQPPTHIRGFLFSQTNDPTPVQVPGVGFTCPPGPWLQKLRMDAHGPGPSPARRREVPRGGTAPHAPPQGTAEAQGDKAAHHLATGGVKAEPALASADTCPKHPFCTE